MPNAPTNRLKTQGNASRKPPVDLFGHPIEETIHQPVMVVPEEVIPEVPRRPFSVIRINPTTVLIWNDDVT